MTRTDEEQAAVDEIRKNPIKVIRRLFGEGGRLMHPMFIHIGADDMPLIVEVKVSDYVYLIVNVWRRGSQSYRQVACEAYYDAPSSGGTGWVLGLVGHCGEVACEGSPEMVRDLAVGDATRQWAYMMNYYTNNRYVDESYAWFFPVGISNAEEFKGLLLHADTDWNK
jgi:hypothetical protein